MSGSFPPDYSLSVMVFGTTFRSLIHFELIFICHITFFYLRIFHFSQCLLWESVFSPLCGLSTFIEDNIFDNIKHVYLWALNSVPWVCMSIFMSVPLYSYFSFVVCFEIRKLGDFWRLFCLPRVPWDIIWIQNDIFIYFKMTLGLPYILLNLQIALSSMDS